MTFFVECPRHSWQPRAFKVRIRSAGGLVELQHGATGWRVLYVRSSKLAGTIALGEQVLIAAIRLSTGIAASETIELLGI